MSEMLVAGSTISHYRILSKIGAGGMGEVYLAEDTRLDRKVAIKLLPSEFTQDADRVRRFMQEAKAASALNHPNIITVYDIGESEAGRFIVMELVSGRTLSKIIAEGISTAEGAGDAGEAQRGERLLALGSQMAKALAAAHGAGITHRDIKPDNIMVRDDGYVKVLDFGLARLLPSGGEDAATVALQTTPGMIMGTVAYMSPEQARGQSASPSSDVFALGIVLYELATAQHPFRAETLVGYLHAITLQTPPPPRRLRPEIPAALDELILRMLRKDASLRPAAVEVAQALQEMERRGDTAKPTYVESETVLLPAAPIGTTSADEGFWVAVLPFKWRGANADLEALAEGLTEDIVTGLSRFSYLRVIARSTTLGYASHSSDVRAIGKEVGARYVMEGNLRQAGPILRVAVQLVDAETGAHLWAEAYDRPYSAEQIFSLQDDLVPRIVSTVADSYGILPHSMSQLVRNKPTAQLTPYEALLRSFSYVERVTSEEHASARAGLERAVEQAPGDSDSWAMLSILHTDEHIHGFSVRTGLLEQALQCARRAVDANPLNHRAHQALAWALCYRKEFDACKHAAERTVALNPMDASALAHVGQTIAYGGGWERGCELLNRAMQLNPNHPGWYRYPLFLNAYRQADYSGALEIALKMSMPGVSLMYVALAAVHGQLSKLDAAREAIRELLVLRRNFKTEARAELEKLWDSELVDRLIEGLHKAGLETVEAERPAARTPAIEPGRKNQSASHQSASSMLALVVLPFTNTSADQENEYFCDGLTEELITDLSKIRSLRVISRNSAMRLKGTTKDLRTIVEELNVRYVLDGSVRKVGQSLRISVQLIDGVSDANLWSDRYNGTLEDIFEMQESVSRSIAKALEITLTADEQRLIEERPIGNAQAYDLYLRARAKFLLGIPSALDRSIELLKQGLDIIGENDLLYAALGYTHYFYFRWISKQDEDHLQLANEYTQKVFAINPSSSHGFCLKGLLCYAEGDIGKSIRFLETAVELEPTNTEALFWLAANNSYINHHEEAMKYADKVRALDPLLPINTLMKGVVYLYDGQFNASLLWAERSLAMEPANLLLIWSIAIIKAWCGKIDEAITHIDTLAQIAPDWVYTQHGLFLKHALRGERDLALRYDTAEFETEAQHDCHFGLHVAHCFAIIGMNDRALDFLERAVRTGMVNSRFLGELDPLLENIRHEKRFKDLMLEAQRLFEQIGDTKKGLESSQDKLVRKPVPGAKEQRPSETSPTSNSSFEEGFWVAVLPFKYRGANADLQALAEGFSEEIITGLSRFSYLRVVAQSSTLRFTSEASDIRTIGIALGARYVMEGSVRQAGSTVRLAVQLVDATNGAHLWAETFDRQFQPNQIFAMQDDLVPRIVSTCADHFGVLARGISEAVRWKDTSQLSPYEALMRGFGYHLRLSAPEHAEAREALEQAVEQAPSNADCWAMLSWIYSHEYAHGFNIQPGSLDRALEAARRAVDLAPSNHLAYQTLAVVLFFRKDKAGCLSAGERSMALNPLDASNESIFLITFTGDWERGCALIIRAMELNPHHPGWYRWVLALNEYRKANYREALDLALKADFLTPAGSGVPGMFWTSMLLAAAYGQLGELEVARDAVRNLLAQKEDFVESARGTLGIWFEPELVEHLVDGLRKAGLEVDASPINSAGIRADEGFWVAVLPFKSTGANTEVTALAEGLTEDITTGLSRFSYLRVIARGSTLLYANQTSDLRPLGKELGARYVMEGTLRQAGTQLRIAVQLVDATTGAHLWAETYSRTFSPEAVFELQDELVPRIVSTVADWYGALPHSMSEAVRLKPSDQLSPYEAVLRSFGYFERIAPEEHDAVRAGLERAVEQSPGSADGWAMLSMIYGEEHRFGFNVRPDPLGRSIQAAQRAVDAGHANHFAWLALAQAMFFRKEFDGFRDAAERAIALNSMDGSTLEYLGHLIAFSGDWDQGCEMAERARQLNPNHPGWYWAVHFLDAYRKGDYRSARSFILKSNQPGHFYTQALVAAVHGQLGEREAADKALRVVLTLKPEFPLIARDEFGKWYLPELVEQLMDGLRKAGLAMAEDENVADIHSATEMSGTDASPAETEKKSSPIQHTVGRKPERDDLRAAFNAAKAGRGSLLCVAGEPGIGKTTLVEDFLAEIASDEKATIARGRCSERLAGTEAYLPLLDALENLLQSGESVSPTMKQVAPTWYAQIVPLSDGSDESARLLAEVKAATQERMKRELAAFLQAVAQARPLVIFFDDLHWADVSTVDLLSFLAGKFDGLRVLIVVTYRPSDMLLAEHPFLQIKPDLQARGVCRELLLEFLSESEIADYLMLEFPGHRFPSEFPKLIHAKTEGSPLFMADLVRYLRDRNVIAQTSGTWMLARGLPDIERELPESVRGMIERKITQLSEEDHKLLTAASVQGYEFDSAVVAQVLSLDADEIEERLEKLERVFAFVKLTSETEFPNRTLTMRYRFIHVLYQNALYTALRATRRATLSREVAQTLETFYDERTASVANELAALCETGREFAKAAHYFHLAAEQARQVFAEQEAAALAERGLQALKSLPDTPERAHQELALQVVLGLALRTIKGFSNPETGKAYLRARELCQQIGDTPQLFPVLFGLWEFDQSTAQLETAIELAELLLAAAGEDESLRLVAHNVMADQLTWVGRFVDAREHLEQGIALYDPERYSSNVFTYGYDSGVACLGFGSIVLWHLGYPDQAFKMSDQACDLALKLPHPLNLAFAASFAAWYYSLVGSMQTAQIQAEAAIAVSEQYDIAMFLAWGKLVKGWALVCQGEIEAGIALSSQGIDEWRASGTLLASSWCLGILAEGNKKAGRPEEALVLVIEALDFASRSGEHFYEAELNRLRGELLLECDDRHSILEGEQCFHHAIAIARQQSAKSLELRSVMSLARLLQKQGKTAEAHQMLAEIYGWFTEGFDTTDLKDARALLKELSVDLEK